MAKKKATSKRGELAPAKKKTHRKAPGSNMIRFDCNFTPEIVKLVEEIAAATPRPGSPNLPQSRMGMLEDLLWTAPKVVKLAKANGVEKPLRPIQGQRPATVKKAAAAKKKATRKKAAKKKA